MSFSSGIQPYLKKMKHFCQVYQNAMFLGYNVTFLNDTGFFSQNIYEEWIKVFFNHYDILHAKCQIKLKSLKSKGIKVDRFKSTI